MQELANINVATATKDQIKETALNLYNGIAEGGNVDELKVRAGIARYELLIKELKGLLKDDAILEVEKYGKGEHTLNGCKFSVAQRSNIQYKEDAEIQRLEQEIKDRKELLKQASKGNAVVFDSLTGEQVDPVSTTYSDVLKCVVQ